MKEGWEEKQLGDVIKLEYGKPLDKKFRKQDGIYPVYGANGEKDRTNRFYVDKPGIIVGRKGSAGEINLTDSKYWPLDVTYFVTFDDRQYDLRFIYYLLITLDLPKLAKGVKPGINRNDVYSINVKYPSLPEQERIVHILDEAFEGIAKAKANAEKNLKNARALFESYLDGVFSNPGKSWEICCLEKYIKFIDYRGHTPAKTKSGMKLITAKNVKNGYLQLEPEEFVNSNIYDKWMVRGIPQKGDVLFTTEAPLANIAQLDTDEKVLFAQRIIILQPQVEKINQTFLKYLLLSKPIKERIFSKATGATVLGIKARLLKLVEIYFPDNLNEQINIVYKLNNILNETQHLASIYHSKLTALEELKKSLLHQAFSGEL